MKRAVFLLLIVSACTPVRVISTEETAGIDFNRYQTFGFFTDDMGLTEYPNFQVLKDAISRELTQRGLQTSDNPDLKINIAADKEDKQQTRETDIRDAPPYMGTRNYTWQSEEIVVREYEEGTVKIDVVDTESNEMVWQGVAAGTITGDQDKMKTRIDKAIDKLFSKFPITEQ